ncbi:AAA family ATPase [Flavihumibacter sp. ZG627]|uniref:AAA family ATPase n=1 Tax=Flavihumibacter sp. ZG627 TaxID=1463156 RepID=UPI00057EC74A|nr:adenylate/guanylate cyclase domain-containing protein [Flavihumibacter sp. ZG627]KIC91858.1 hypothetical protein HY58_06500 [Flavihumibacter sp. ZG627]
MQHKILTDDEPQLIIASFVPKMLREAFSHSPLRIPGELLGEEAALLWIDICDFSPLSNRLLQDHVNGVEQISMILKNHYDPVLTLIRKFGGQPVLFAGDGVLAAWPCSLESSREAALRATACGDAILQSPGATNDRGERLRLHVVAAGGACQLLEISGMYGRWHYTVMGDALRDLRSCASTRRPGELLVSANVMAALRHDHDIDEITGNAGILTVQPGNYQRHDAASILFDGNAKKTLELFIPLPVSFNLDAAHLQWIDELRPVTIVFTQLYHIDPDTALASQSMQKAVNCIAPVLIRHNGILSQTWFDEKAANILIVFGPPPAAHKDNPHRGVLTAIQIKEVLSAAGFDACVGVATGKAFCGILGNDDLRQYTVIGDVVNFAARLAQLQLGQITCDESTMKATRDDFFYADPLELPIKGHGDKVKVWNPVSIESRSGNKIEGHPLVGRQKEKFLLEELFNMAMSGGSAALALMGESGSGKSRLLSDFRSRMIGLEVEQFSSSGDPVEQTTPYYSWRSIIGKMTGTTSIMGKEAMRESVNEYLGEEMKEKAGLLNAVLALDMDDSEFIRSLTTHQREEETRKLLLNILQRAASEKPMVLIIDDAHWMDEASWQLASVVAQQVKNCLLILALEPVRGQQAERFHHAGAIIHMLEPLSAEEQEELIKAILSVDHVNSSVTNIIAQLSKGSPFYCVEIIQALHHEGAILINDNSCVATNATSLENLPLPETIQGMIRMRLDNIEQGPKLALKVASVTGMRFATELVQDIFPIQQEKTMVPNFLKENNRAGLILHERIDGGNGYSFHNGITREVAYEMILSEQKKKLHHEIANWYETNFHHNLNAIYARLAYHWEKAGNNAKAADYLEKESIHLFSNGFARQSVDVGLKGVELLGVKIERDPAMIGVTIGANMGKIMALMGDQKPSDLISLKKLEDPVIDRIILMLLRIGPLAFQSQQIELFALISVTCLRMTLEHGSGTAAADVYSMYSPIYRGMTGDRTGAYAWSQLALDMDKNNQHSLFARVAFVHTWFHNHWSHPFSNSLPLSLEAARHGFASGDILFACFNLSGHVVYMTACGRPLQEIKERAREHMDINQRRVMNAAFHLILELQFAKALAGETEHPLSLTDHEYNEEKDLASIFQTELGNQIGYYLVARVKLHLHHNDWKGALDWAEKAIPLRPAIEGQIAEVDLVQFETLAALTGLLNNGSSPELMERSLAGISTMRHWAGLCSTNFEHKAQLLEGIMAGAKGDGIQAEERLRSALVLAENAAFLHDIALIQKYRHLLSITNGAPAGKEEEMKNAYERWGASVPSLQ